VLLIALRDLQWRRRRFIIAVLATSLVFALTLLLSGAGNGLRGEAQRATDGFGADAWIVPKGTSGPFTASSVMAASAADSVAKLPGVQRADPFVYFRATFGKPHPKDVNVIGYRVGGLGGPTPAEGRAPVRPGEAVVDAGLGAKVGETAVMGGRRFKVTGVAHKVSFNFGVPTVFVPIEDVQAMAFAGRPLATAVVTKGTPSAAPQGMTLLTNDQVVSDMRRPMASGLQTIDFINALLWVIAAGIIGSIVYLSALERARDFAVLKATGAGNGPLFGGLALQALVLSAASALVAVVLAKPLKAGFPFTVDIPTSAYVVLLLVALFVGFLASLAGLRRAVRADPALAFGGA
jgi:putative ABC transport system permease protein